MIVVEFCDEHRETDSVAAFQKLCPVNNAENGSRNYRRGGESTMQEYILGKSWNRTGKFMKQKTLYPLMLSGYKMQMSFPCVIVLILITKKVIVLHLGKQCHTDRRRKCKTTSSMRPKLYIYIISGN